MSMVTVDELPEFCYMLPRRMTSTLKRTEVAANIPSDRNVPGPGGGGSGGRVRRAHACGTSELLGRRDTLT